MSASEDERGQQEHVKHICKGCGSENANGRTKTSRVTSREYWVCEKCDFELIVVPPPKKLDFKGPQDECALCGNIIAGGRWLKLPKDFWINYVCRRCEDEYRCGQSGFPTAETFILDQYDNQVDAARFLRK